MGDFPASHPAIELALVSEHRNSDLSRGEADIAIRVGDPRQVDLAARKLGEVAYGLYGHPNQVALLAEQRNYIGFDNGIATLPQQRWLEQRMAGEHCVMRCNDMLSMLQAAQQGWGLALLPCFLVPPQSGLQRLVIPQPPFSLPVYLVMHPDVRRAPRVRSTADYLIRLFQTHAPVLAG
jgi:DNA-binding transcriptional LysR family regulator